MCLVITVYINGMYRFVRQNSGTFVSYEAKMKVEI